MGKRIRHLEYYGYADQNIYVGLPNVDLSDIREVNKEQTKEINAISSVTKDKADLSTVNELSGKVNTFIDRQDHINQWFGRGINKNKERIDGLEVRDEEITTKINEIVDDFGTLYDDFNILSGHVDDVDDRLSRHIEEASSFEDETNQKINSLSGGILVKIDKEEAYDVFAKKTDVYTKSEVDELVIHGVDGYATQEWVLNQGYISENDANSRFATKSRVNAIDDRVTSLQTTTYEISGELSQFKTVTDGKINLLGDRVDTLEVKHDSDIASLQNEDALLRGDVDSNSSDIYEIINTLLPSKADKADLDNVASIVDSIAAELANKVDKADYIRDQSLVEVELNDIKDNKADKSQLNIVSGTVESLGNKLDEEIQNRINGDNLLNSKIGSANTRIDIIREENVTRDRKIRDLEYGLSAETIAREEAILNVIGTPSDVDEDNTIYGAKSYADKVANQALASAKVYAESGDGRVLDYVDETKADLERQITSKADKSYVDATKVEIQASIDDKVAAEKNRAENIEASLGAAIRQETLRAISKEIAISSALTHTSNIVHALTDWDGDDRIDYTDVGNGIVDVMHRELHDVMKKIGSMSLGIITTNEYEFGIGTYNVSNTGDDDADKTVFSVGIGTSDTDRRNAFEIRKDGSMYVLVDGELIRFNGFEEEIGGLIAEASYDSEDHLIHFKNKDGVEIDSIDVTEFSSSTIERVWYENGIIYIKFSNGDVVDIDVKELIDESEFSDGLQVNDGIVSVLIDPTSENYLTCSQDGIKISGINSKVEEETNRALAAEQAIDDKINNLTFDCGIY